MQQREWIGGRFRAPFYIEEGEPYRPEIVIWLDLEAGCIVGSDVVHPSAPPQALAECLARTILKPLQGKPGRPDRLRVADQAIAESLRVVAGDTIAIETAPTPELEAFVQLMAENLPPPDDRDVEPSYLEGGRIGAAVVGDLFTSAARFYRASPWHLLFDSQVMRLDIDELDVCGGCLSIIGVMGESLGVILFASLEEYRIFCERTEEHLGGETIPRDLGVPTLGLHFYLRGELPKSMLKEIRTYGWKVAGKDAYPVVLNVDPDAISRPLVESDVRKMIAAAEAVTRFISKHREMLEEGHGQPAVEEFTHEGPAGPLTVKLTAPYPGVIWDEFLGEDDPGDSEQ